MKLKKIILFLIMVLIAVSCSKKDEMTIEGDSYSFQKPAGWEESGQAPENTLLMFENPVYEQSDVNINPRIIISRDSNDIFKSSSYITQIEKLLSGSINGYNRIYAGDYKKDSVKRLIYTGIWGIETKIIKTDTIIFTKGSTAYYVQYSCEPSDYDLYLQYFIDVADSFSFR